MPTFERSIEIRMARQALFDLTQDYDRRLEWDPFLREARLLGGATTPALGVRAWCVEKGRFGIGRFGMETEYVRFSRPQVVAVKMTAGPVPLERFAASWRFEALAPNLTRLIWRYHLALRPRWLRPLLTPIVLCFFARSMDKRLMALKAGAETAAAPAAATPAA